MTLAERIVDLDRALARGGVPHAFGGAIALAYWTGDPRATSDVDLNLFVAASDAQRGLRALPPGVAVPASTAEAVARDGQVRLWWDDTPVDLFFDYAPIHAQAAEHCRVVPFASTRIPVLGPTELAVFKIMFDRTRDWADIEEMLAAETFDVLAVRDALEAMLDPDDPRFTRLSDTVRRAAR